MSSTAEGSEAVKSSSDFTLSSRWTPALAASGGWTPVIDAFLDHYASLDMSSGEAMLVIQVMRHKWSNESPFPSFVIIAKRMGISPTAARKHARNLEKRGLLVRRKRPGKRTIAFDFSSLFYQLEVHVKQSPAIIRKKDIPSTSIAIETESEEIPLVEDFDDMNEFHQFIHSSVLPRTNSND